MLVHPGLHHRLTAGVHLALVCLPGRSEVSARLGGHGDGSIVWHNRWHFTLQASDINLSTTIDGDLIILLSNNALSLSGLQDGIFLQVHIQTLSARVDYQLIGVCLSIGSCRVG